MADFQDPRPGRGIYIHVPFCLAKCSYCNFNSCPSDEGVPDAYVRALVRDMECEAADWREDPGGGGFASVYIGGGTPSLLTPEQMSCITSSLASHYGLAADAEVTVECNPRTVDRRKLGAYRSLGVNRISVGVQSLAAGELRLLGRIHEPADALGALEEARAAGFTDLSADVILGIPGQDPGSLSATLRGILGRVTHVSAYVLTLEAGTALERLVAGGRVKMPDEETVIGLYGLARTVLAEAGLAPYEISNYSLPGYRCRHNEVYWRRGSYVGFGAGAHSHRDGLRYSKIQDPVRYVQAVGRPGGVVDFSEVLTPCQMLLEEVVLGLRTVEGVGFEGLAGRYDLELDRLSRLLDDLVLNGLLVRKGKNVTLSPKAVLLHDAISEEVAAVLPTNA
jgi:oxygen-independent coproporphyrinogen III oxidase